MFKTLFENEPRVHVIDSALPYYVHQHGETMLGWHHGHLKQKASLPLVFATQFAKVWGATTKRYIHTGHQHHGTRKSTPASTSYSTRRWPRATHTPPRGGWISERKATAITYHSRFGEVARTTATPEMLAAECG
jgi:hypothetical protein